MKLTIPNDWQQNNGYTLVWFCIPNSPKWRATVYGKLYELTWWYNWDKNTGVINDAKARANEILESLCMANCDDIVLALNRIADALAGDGQTTNGLADMQATLDQIKQHIDQLETIQNNAVKVMGGTIEVVLPGGV